jgi:alanyl-tRNA synthetase
VDEQDAEKVSRFLEHLNGRVQWLKERVAKEKEEINNLRLKNVSKEAMSLAGEVRKIKEINVLLKDFSEYNIEMLRTISDVIQKQVKSCLIVLASILNGKVRFLITVTEDLVGKGYSAKRLAEAFGEAVGGKGGGRETKAEGGGDDPSKIKGAFDKVLAAL